MDDNPLMDALIAIVRLLVVCAESQERGDPKLTLLLPISCTLTELFTDYAIFRGRYEVVNQAAWMSS